MQSPGGASLLFGQHLKTVDAKDAIRSGCANVHDVKPKPRPSSRLLGKRLHKRVLQRKTSHSRARFGAVASYQSCDQDGKVQDAKDSFEDRKGTYLRRDRGNPSSAERSHGAETVVNEIKAVGNVMKVGARIQIKGVWLERS